MGITVAELKKKNKPCAEDKSNERILIFIEKKKRKKYNVVLKSIFSNDTFYETNSSNTISNKTLPRVYRIFLNAWVM